jgi:hypothetical protein
VNQPSVDATARALLAAAALDEAGKALYVDASMEFRARQFGLKVREMPTPADVREKSGNNAS